MKYWDVMINTDGSITSLYTDEIPWRELGEMDVQRVSDVVFNTLHQAFEIHDLKGRSMIGLGLFVLRSQAIQAEIAHFFDKLAKGETIKTSN